MKNLIISFSPLSEKTFAKFQKDGTTTFELYTEDFRVLCNVFYDFSPKPLTLSAKYKSGDSIQVVLMPHRIELRRENEILDEEWPAGNRLLETDDAIDSNCKISVEEYIEPDTPVPAIISTFENALGWRPEENIFVGDCMPYTDLGRYHVLYLKDRHHHQSKWGLGAHQWEHISTDDFIRWSIHPMAVPIDNSAEASICTGSHIRKGDFHHLYYTVRTCDGSPAPICRSISRDGYHFEKDSDFSFALSDKYDAVTARDPKVILAEDGLYHMLLTTRLIEKDKGCLAHLVSRDLEKWTELTEPEHICDDNTEPECPDYIEFGGYYYLIYSLHGKAYYKYSKEPFGNWITPQNPEVPCSSVPKGAVWQGKIVFTGFNRINCYAGTLTFKNATNAPNGELIFE